MKKLICVLIFVLAFFVASCNDAVEPIAPPGKIHIDYETRMEPFYIDRPVETDLSRQIAEYAKSGMASQEYMSLYSKADSTRIIPIYGRYLEYSSLVCCAFLNGEKIIGSRSMAVCYEDGKINIKEIRHVLTKDNFNYPESNYRLLKSLDSEYLKNFTMIGIGYVASINSGSDVVETLIGINNETSYMVFVGGLAMLDFVHVEPFKTIEEDQTLYREYLKENK